MGSQALAVIAPQQTQEIDIFRLGEVFSQSGYFTDAKDASQAIVKILAGREIGIGAMASMTGFHIVQGKPTLSANLIASIIKNKNSGYNYRVLELTDAACEIEFFERGESIGKSRYTTEEANKAGLLSKDIWKKYPKNMLFARAISNGARWFTPDVFNGATVYTPEELDAEVNGDGEIINFPRPQNKPQPVETKAGAPAARISALSAEESKSRDEIIKLSNAIGKNPVQTLDYFDANPDMRANCLRKVQRVAVKSVIASGDWAYSEDGTTEFLARFGIEAIDSASDDALAAVVEELRDLGLL